MGTEQGEDKEGQGEQPPGDAGQEVAEEAGRGKSVAAERTALNACHQQGWEEKGRKADRFAEERSAEGSLRGRCAGRVPYRFRKQMKVTDEEGRERRTECDQQNKEGEAPARAEAVVAEEEAAGGGFGWSGRNG